MTDPARITIYTDGGCDPNPGPGGWAALLIDEASGARRELSGADPQTTNNRMELTAAIEALRALKRPCVVALFTDSEYLKNGITAWMPGWVKKGWRTKKGEPVKNSDLWQALYAETQRHQLEWHWVRGHAGDEHNERVDQLATAALQQLTAAAAPALPATDFAIALRVCVPAHGGPGGYAFRVAPTSGDSPPVVRTGRESATTAYRLGLVAALAALRAVPPGASVLVFCADANLCKGMTEWVPRWQRNGWLNSKNKPVDQRALWEALLAEASTRRVTWQIEPHPAPALAADLDRLAAEAVE